METSPQTASQQRDRFLKVAAAHARLCREGGIRVEPWHDPAVPYFSGMGSAHQAALLASLEAAEHALANCLRAGKPLTDSWFILEHYLRTMGLAPAPDLRSFMGKDDYIATYDLGPKLNFLGPNHFIHMSYSLEDLYCRPWLTLFRREEKVEKILLERLYPFVQGKRERTISNEDIPPHIIVEVLSPGRKSVTVESKCYSPLFRRGAPAGMIAVNHGVRPALRILPRPNLAPPN